MGDELEKQVFFLDVDEEETDHPKKVISDDEWVEDVDGEDEEDDDKEADPTEEEEV